MSFGGFRLSDGSYNYQGISIAKLKTLSPLQHLNFSISPRPLLKNILQNSRYKKMYLAHIRTILEQNILNNHYLEVAEEVHNFIEPYVLRDTNKFYSYEDFKNNLYTTTGSGGSQIAGIKDLMESRANFLMNFEGVAGAPSILSEQFLPRNPKLNSSVNFYLETENAKKAFLYYRTKSNYPFNCIEMFDNGLNGDDVANDGVFSVSVQLKSKTYQYYYWVENYVAGEFLPKEAANKFFSLNIQAESGDIVINEVYFSDNNVLIEIFNNTSNEFCLDGMYISQNSNFNYHFPDTILSPFSFYVIEENYLNGGLKEDVLFLFNNNNLLIDSIIVVNTRSEKSIGRYPNGNGDFCFTKPTIGFSNILKNYANISFELYPNPTEDYVNIEILPKYKLNKIIILDYFGKIMYSNIVNNNEIYLFKVDASAWSKGVYLVCLIGEDKTMSKKLIIR